MIQTIARIRHARFATHAGYRDDAAALAGMVEALRERVALARDGGDFRRLDDRAYLLWWREPVAWHGAPAQIVWLDHTGDPRAIRWLCDQLDQVPIDPTFECMLDAGYTAVRAHLIARGMGIDSLSMLGTPTVALAGLMAERPPARTHPAVEIRPLVPADVEGVLGLSRAVFNATPEYCWFGAHPVFLERRAADLRQPARGPRETIWMGDRLVGFWSADIDASPYWGQAGGMDFVLLPEARGLGLAKIGYRRLLEALIARDVPVFKGGTNQPPVLHLSRRMQRRPWQTWIRAHAPFPPAHFRALLPIDGSSELP